jgi:hypothetical protein
MVVVPGACTPRRVMHRCSASMTTPTPTGESWALNQLATWTVSLS